MTRNGWYESLANALEKDDNAVLQLATIDPSTDTPRVRSVRPRGFVTADALPALPLVVLTTDVRTPKVAQLAAQPRAEVVYWMPSTQEQFRVRGRASVVPAPRCSYPYPPLPAVSVVYEALEKEGYDWEMKRVASFDGTSGRLKASLCRPVPGTPLEDAEEEMKRWPRTLPKMEEAESDEERQNLETALRNFALLLVEPFEVDYTEFGMEPERRRLYQRDWEDEHGVEFRETLIVP